MFPQLQIMRTKQAEPKKVIPTVDMGPKFIPEEKMKPTGKPLTMEERRLVSIFPAVILPKFWTPSRPQYRQLPLKEQEYVMKSVALFIEEDDGRFELFHKSIKYEFMRALDVGELTATFMAAGAMYDFGFHPTTDYFRKYGWRDVSDKQPRASWKAMHWDFMPNDHKALLLDFLFGNIWVFGPKAREARVAKRNWEDRKKVVNGKDDDKKPAAKVGTTPKRVNPYKKKVALKEKEVAPKEMEVDEEFPDGEIPDADILAVDMEEKAKVSVVTPEKKKAPEKKGPVFRISNVDV